MFELNIGLEVGRDGEEIPAVIAINLLATEFCDCEYHTRVDGNTLVVKLVPPKNKILTNHVYALAQLLLQDCIALYNTETGEGSLIGPNAVSWGKFDLAQFTRWEAKAGLDLLA